MFYAIYSDNGLSLLDINVMGFTSDVTATRFGPGFRNFYIIHYVTKGKGYYNGNAVSEGQGFLIYPGQSEEYHADPNDPWEFLWFISSDDKMKDVFCKYNADKDTLIFSYDSVPIARKIAKEIVRRNNELADPFEILELFLQILNSHTYLRVMEKQKTNSEIYLDFCIEYIRTNVHNKISVERLTQLTGVSQPYLYSIFKNKFNMSTKEYITWYKIKCAKKMLVETDASITEIANSVGFGNVLSFSKAFYANQKISPSKYRTKKKQTIL